MSTLSVINLQSQSTTSPVVFQTSTGTEIGQLCRAWVNFNGTTSPGTIRASFNVSSITKNATGDYTVNFTNSFSDVSYSASVSSLTTTLSAWGQYSQGCSPATSSFRFTAGRDSGGNLADGNNICVSIFR